MENKEQFLPTKKEEDWFEVIDKPLNLKEAKWPFGVGIIAGSPKISHSGVQPWQNILHNPDNVLFENEKNEEEENWFTVSDNFDSSIFRGRRLSFTKTIDLPCQVYQHQPQPLPIISQSPWLKSTVEPDLNIRTLD